MRHVRLIRGAILDSQFARIHAGLFGRAHAAIALKISEFRAVRLLDRPPPGLPNFRLQMRRCTRPPTASRDLSSVSYPPRLLPSIQAEASPFTIVLDLIFGEIKANENLKVRSGYRLVRTRDDDPLDNFCFARYGAV